MAINDIIDLLKKTMGLDPASLGPSAIERAVDVRRRECGLPDLDAYWGHLSQSAAELLELIDAVAVPETWFFRHAESFAALQQIVWKDFLSRDNQPELRLLSVPCSTGEEPYSIAMTLISAGLPPARFRVDAVDISPGALLQAERGVYGRNSFRGGDLSFRDRFFSETPQGWRVSKELAATVSFSGGNLLAEEFLPGRALYDVIFCRNLLIYFHNVGQKRAIKTLARLIKPEGRLFVGPAEAGMMIHHDLVSLKLPMAFAFRKSPPPNSSDVRVPDQGSKPRRPIAQVRRFDRKSSPAVHSSPRMADHGRRAQMPVVNPAPNLDLAGRLADEGRLDEASAVCEEYLKVNQASARAFYILGVVRDAKGDPEKAGDYYRRALYLEPNHYDALMHLAYSTEKRGGTVAARNLRDRARRIKERTKNV